MRILKVFIEMDGVQRYVGNIEGESFSEACFAYSKDYMDSEFGRPISVSLPFMDGEYSSKQTAQFFEGLLPEGFSRKAVADWIKTDERDYITMLAVLGRECLGAIRIVESDESMSSSYEKLSLEQVKELAAEGATKSTQMLMETHLSLTGATGKVGLYYDEGNGEWYLPKGEAPSTHIVKQSHVRFEKIVLNEQLCMLTAKKLGIDTPESFVVNAGDGQDSEVLFATKRYDRMIDGGKKISGFRSPNRLHQEDFAQAMGISSTDKYEREPAGYLGKMFDVIRAYCTDPLGDQLELWRRVCFNYLIGNTDCHIKNHSLLYGKDLKSIRLAPAYDIVCTRVYSTTRQMSYYLGDEIDIDKVNRKHILAAAADAGLSERMAMKIFDEIADSIDGAVSEAAEDLLSKGLSGAEEMAHRISMARINIM